MLLVAMRDARNVADAFEEASTALVYVQRVRPVPFVVVVDTEVVERDRLALEIAELLEDRERKPTEGDALGRSQLRVGEMEEHVRVRELLLVVLLRVPPRRPRCTA